jgi:hypothetical protein
MEEITICDLVFTEDERNLIINHWLKDYVPNGKYFLLDCVMNDMKISIRDNNASTLYTLYRLASKECLECLISILGRDSYTVPYIRVLDKTIISFLMSAPLGQKTFENLPEQIKNKALANSL